MEMRADFRDKPIEYVLEQLREFRFELLEDQEREDETHSINMLIGVECYLVKRRLGILTKIERDDFTTFFISKQE